MHVRPQFRDILIAQKMTKWCRMARWEVPALRCRARRNFWRLCARYPHVMHRLKLRESSVYE